jgi:hypothetical protein
MKNYRMESTVDSEDKWTMEARRVIKSLMARNGLDYQTLADKLNMAGVPTNQRQLTNKVNRGTFSFAFVLQLMAALEVKNIDIGAHRQD